MTLAESQDAQSFTGSIAAAYDRDGFVFPIDIASPDDARLIRSDLEAAQAELADDPEKLALLRSYPNRLLPSFDRLIRREKLIAAASQIFGPDLMVWNAGLFIKEAHSSSVVSWHQDLTYWGLDDADETTCWVALSPATAQSGCMKFVPGSHKKQLVPHVDTFAEDNLLTRGQEIAVEVNESDAVQAELMPGQASLHHGHLFHASGPNTTEDRRIGLAIRVIKPSMRQQSGHPSLVTLINGEDRYGHFTIAEPPRGRLAEEDFEICRRDSEIRQQVLYRGTGAQNGSRS